MMNKTLLGLVLTVAGVGCAAGDGTGEDNQSSAAAVTAKPAVTWSSALTRSSNDGQITNGNGGCLDLPNGDTTNGNLLHIWQCDSTGWNQTWFVDAKGSIHYAANPAKCVDFPAQDLVKGVPTDETQLQLWDCNGASGPDQVWQLTSAGNIEFAADTAKCVELRNGSSANNTPVQVFDCNGTSGQTWQLAQVGTALQGFQVQDANGACLQPVSTAAGAALELAPCNGNVTDQQWGVNGRSSGLFNYATNQYVTFPPQDMTASTFVPETQLVMASDNSAQTQQIAMNSSNHTMLIGGLACIEARNGSSAAGTAAQGFTCNGTSGQTWFPKPMGGTCAGTVNPDGSCPTVAGTSCENSPSSCTATVTGAINPVTGQRDNVAGTGYIGISCTGIGNGIYTVSLTSAPWETSGMFQVMPNGPWVGYNNYGTGTEQWTFNGSAIDPGPVDEDDMYLPGCNPANYKAAACTIHATFVQVCAQPGTAPFTNQSGICGNLESFPQQCIEVPVTYQ